MRRVVPGVEEILNKCAASFKTKTRGTFFLYLAVSEHVISAVLIRDVEKVQCPVYYISQVLQDTETHYNNLEKLSFALLIAVRKL